MHRVIVNEKIPVSYYCNGSAKSSGISVEHTCILNKEIGNLDLRPSA
jgi:hypothetical protein